MSEKHRKEPADLAEMAAGSGPRDFLQIFKRGVQFTEELLKENERLRGRLVQLEEENRMLAEKSLGAAEYKELLEQLRLLGEERAQLFDRFQSVERENMDYQQRYREIEDENNRLANLYIASYQLHSTLLLDELMRVISEIIINLIGGREFALYLSQGQQLRPLIVYGRPADKAPTLTEGRGVAGRAARKKTVYVSEDQGKANPAVCIPLVVADRLLGMIVIWAFLPHKDSVTELDRELFHLIGLHAAAALHSARLHAEWDGRIENGFEAYCKLVGQ